MCSLNDNSVLLTFCEAKSKPTLTAIVIMVVAAQQTECAVCYAELIMVVVNMMVLVKARCRVGLQNL